MAKPLNLEIFIERAAKKHNNFYSYELAEYNGSHGLVKIICPNHGVFEQRAYAHLNGARCIECFNEGDTHIGNKYRKSKSLLIEQFKEKHGDRFDYSLMEYKSTNEKIKIRCIKHDEIFEQTSKNHLTGQVGCSQCKNEIFHLHNKNKSYRTFTTRAKAKYGDHYTYDFDSFETNRGNVTINCKLHGNFTMSQHLVLHTCACPICHPKEYVDTTSYTKTNYIKLCKDTGSNLYLMRLSNENELFYKIGISNNLTRRAKDIAGDYPVELVHSIFSADPGKVWTNERKLHKIFKEKSYSPLIKFKGENECFVFDTLDECITLMNELMKDE